MRVMIIKLRQDLKLLEIEFTTEVLRVGINATVARTGLKYQDIQSYLKGRRKWSYEKLLNISEKLEASRHPLEEINEKELNTI